MRKTSFGINMSIDGYCDHTIGNPSDELMDYFTRMIYDADLVFFGRVMYELMFPYWADVSKNKSGTDGENRFADRLTAINKVVVSKTLSIAEYNTQIISGNPAEELRKLKQQPGGNILIDSISMLPELTTAGLIDEFNLVLHPVIVAQGRKLFGAGSLSEKVNLTLVDTLLFKDGCIALHYIKQ